MPRPSRLRSIQLPPHPHPVLQPCTPPGLACTPACCLHTPWNFLAPNQPSARPQAPVSAPRLSSAALPAPSTVPTAPPPTSLPPFPCQWACRCDPQTRLSLLELGRSPKGAGGRPGARPPAQGRTGSSEPTLTPRAFSPAPPQHALVCGLPCGGPLCSCLTVLPRLLPSCQSVAAGRWALLL